MVRICSTEFLSNDDNYDPTPTNSFYSDDTLYIDEAFEDYLDNTKPSQRKKPLNFKRIPRSKPKPTPPIQPG